MPFAFNLGLFYTWERPVGTFDMAQRYVNLVFFIRNPSIVVNPYADAEESPVRVDVVKQIVVMEVLVEVGVRAFEV